MRLDKVIEADRRKESESTLEECCRIIGCIDLRTAQMHMERLEEAAKAATLTLAEMQAAAVHLHEPSYPLRPLAPLERLEELLGRQEAPVSILAVTAAGGAVEKTAKSFNELCLTSSSRLMINLLQKPSGGAHGKDRLERHR
jgi:hypothetical protein